MAEIKVLDGDGSPQYMLMASGDGTTGNGFVPPNAITSIVPGTGATNLGKAEDAAHTSGDVGVLAMTVRQDSAAALAGTDADYQPLITDATGRLWVIVGGTVTVASHAVTNAGTFAVQAAQSGTWAVDLGATDNAVLDAIAASLAGTLTVGSHAVTNAGTFAVQAACTNAGTFAVQAACTNAGTFAVQVDGSALTALQLIDDVIFADDAAFTPGTSKVAAIGLQADEGSTDSVDEGDVGCPRMTLDRKAITNPQPHTAGGLSIARDIDLDNGTLTVVKNAAGQLYGWDITNTTTATVFVKLYDAASGTLGTGTPVLTIAIPGNASDDTLSSKSLPFGVTFATGICAGAGTGVADADNTDPGANGVVANFYYK